MTVLSVQFWLGISVSDELLSSSEEGIFCCVKWKVSLLHMT